MAKGTMKFLLLCVCSLFVSTEVAANSCNVYTLRIDTLVARKPTLQEKIAAFMASGVEKKINTDHYEKDSVIAFAESLIGTPHRMGGYSSSGIDCSGLVTLVHAKYGVNLPRSSHDQARYGTIIYRYDELQPGDLVFFHSTYKKEQLVTHSGIYLGDNKFIHTSANRGVVISTLRDAGYYEAHYLFATRLTE